MPKLDLKPMNYTKGRREYRSKVNVIEFTSILVITCITRGLRRFFAVLNMNEFIAFGKIICTGRIMTYYARSFKRTAYSTGLFQRRILKGPTNA